MTLSHLLFNPRGHQYDAEAVPFLVNLVYREGRRHQIRKRDTRCTVLRYSARAPMAPSHLALMP